MFGANSVETTFQTGMGAAIIHASLIHTDFSILNDVIMRSVDLLKVSVIIYFDSQGFYLDISN